MPFPQGSGLNQLTGDITAGPGTGSQAATLVGTSNVNTVVSDLQTISANVVRRSATANAGLGECTVFNGSTAAQTITLPNPGTNAAVYRIVNDATVAVSILGGTQSLSINGTVYSASTPFSVASGTSYDFVFDQTGVWQCMAISQTAGTAGALTLLASSVLAAPAANFTFSSIAGTYNHLEVVIIGRSAAVANSDQVEVQFNGDTAGNYEYLYFNANGSTASSGVAAAAAFVTSSQFPGANATANFPGEGTIRLPLYAGTTFYKTALSTFGVTAAAVTGGLSMIAGTWKNTAAITSIKLFLSSGSNFIIGSAAYLYGIT